MIIKRKWKDFSWKEFKKFINESLASKCKLEEEEEKIEIQFFGSNNNKVSNCLHPLE
jgi:hypothetical protein